LVVEHRMTEEELAALKKVKNGHSRKMNQRIITARRNALFNLISRGFNLSQASAALSISLATAHNDLNFIRAEMPENMRKFLEEELCMRYFETMEMTQGLLKFTNDILNDNTVPLPLKLGASAQQLEILSFKKDLIADPRSTSE
jgi:hypothetical protein